MIKRITAAILALTILAASAALMSCGGSDDKYLKLVNKENVVDAKYVPENIVDVDTAYTNGGKSVQLEETAAKAAIKMLDDMKKAGLEGVSITSGYRTYNRQKSLFDGYCAKEAAAHPDWSEEQIKAQVLTYSAAPGTSEHQTGLCMDLFTTEMADLVNYGDETQSNPYDKGFAETEAYTWLCENAHKYGFILRFPEDKTDVTGYAFESWHYRYVGESAAKKIHSKGITLEEYLK